MNKFLFFMNRMQFVPNKYILNFHIFIMTAVPTLGVKPRHRHTIWQN